MNHETREPHSLMDLLAPIHLALGAVGLGAFCAADLLWRVLPLIR
jgi:hypothetical protein